MMTSEGSDPAGYTDDAAETHVPRVGRSHRVFESLIARTRGIPAVPTAVVWPDDAHALKGPVDAAREQIIKPVLIGDAARIHAVADTAGLNLGDCMIVDAPTEAEAAAAAVGMVRDRKTRAIMKGSLHTDVLMHAVVSIDGGLRTGRRISHVFLIAAPRYPEILFVTDAAINIFPDLDCKRDIVQNAIDLHIGLGLGEPRVALLSAVEVINSRIPGTIDAAVLCKMADRGQITGGVLDGPLAMDNAVSAEAAKLKGIVSPVAGRAQILVAPDLEAGNMLAKNLIYMAGADAAGIVLGARVPVILPSRADSVPARLASAAVGGLYAHHLAQANNKPGTKP